MLLSEPVGIDHGKRKPIERSRILSRILVELFDVRRRQKPVNCACDAIGELCVSVCSVQIQVFGTKANEHDQYAQIALSWGLQGRRCWLVAEAADRGLALLREVRPDASGGIAAVSVFGVGVLGVGVLAVAERASG